jgi:hypothetical protein
LGLVPVEVTMSHKQTTYTVIAAFAPRAPEGLDSHEAAVLGVAVWAGEWLKNEHSRGRVLADNVGFTVARTFGGGAGWPVERGVTVTFAGLTPGHADLVRDFAKALRALEDQEAVCVLSRVERFDLV